VLFLAAASVLVFPFTMLLPVFARDLGVGPQGLGWLYSATGAGALLGGLALAGTADRFRRGRLLTVSGIAFATFVGAFALSTNYALSLLLIAAAGFSMIFTTATANSVLQSLVPNPLRGRVMSVYVFMFQGLTPLGYLQAGMLADVVGAPLALATGAIVLLTVMSVFMWNSSRARRATAVAHGLSLGSEVGAEPDLKRPA
jgi:predicted MFS family arabinose efflux permease